MKFSMSPYIFEIYKVKWQFFQNIFLVLCHFHYCNSIWYFHESEFYEKKTKLNILSCPWEYGNTSWPEVSKVKTRFLKATNFQEKMRVFNLNYHSKPLYQVGLWIKLIQNVEYSRKIFYFFYFSFMTLKETNSYKNWVSISC